MRLWHYASQAILTAQDHLSTSLSATTTTTTTTSTISPQPNPTTEPMAALHHSNATIYFGYGSNLWLKQMHQRCPNSTYLGIARLNDYEWVINERGYANVVEIGKDGDGNKSSSSSSSASSDHPSTAFAAAASTAAQHPLSSAKEEGEEENASISGRNSKGKFSSYATQVYGLVYALQPSDEARLDRNEGVPVAYTKEVLECDFWAVDDQSSKPVDVTSEKPERVDMLVYINREAVTPSEPREEYVYRMNMGIRDAVREGVPEGYVSEVLRGFIPKVEGDEVVEVAGRQALEFEDER